jgi:C-terminal processing protease CtpA/Prc
VAKKNGAGHDDFESYKGVFKDKNDNKKFGKRVIVLTNRGVYGTASVFAGAAKGFSNVRLMGDTTGGGGSINASYELANGWIITYPAAKLRTGEGQSMNEGIVPFYKVQMTKADEDAGKDTILEAAIAEINKP